MDIDDDSLVQRGFVLEPMYGRYRATPLSTIEELQFHLLLSSRTIVLPAYPNKTTSQVLTDSGVSPEFLKAHLDDTPYSSRGSRPQDAIAKYFWRIPRFVSSCDECSTEYSTESPGSVIQLSVSLWISKQQDISVLLIEQSATGCDHPEDPSLEDELQEKMPHAVCNTSIQDYINQLAYERWAEYIARLTIRGVFREKSTRLIWNALVSIEQNLDTARHIASEGGELYLADEHAWDDLLRRLGRRMHYIKH